MGADERRWWDLNPRGVGFVASGPFSARAMLAPIATLYEPPSGGEVVDSFEIAGNRPRGTGE